MTGSINTTCRRPWGRSALRLVIVGAIVAGILGADRPAVEPPYADPPMPPYRIVATGFEADEADIRRLLDSAGRELWRYFPDHQIEPFVVERGRSHPIVLFARNRRGEIVMRLSTGETYWSQYAFQFAHEFCHIVCGFQDGDGGNQWFEETLCETASLFVLRRMAEAWKDDPPYPHWRDYSASLASYARERIERNGGAGDARPIDLAGEYRRHRDGLRADSKHNDLHARFAVALLPLFEEDPRRWEAVRWLNAQRRPEGETFAAYLARWHRAVPEGHRAFVEDIARRFDVPLPAADNAAMPD